MTTFWFKSMWWLYEHYSGASTRRTPAQRPAPYSAMPQVGRNHWVQHG